MSTILLSPNLEPEFRAAWREFLDNDAGGAPRVADPQCDGVTDLGLLRYREVPAEFVDQLRGGGPGA